MLDSGLLQNDIVLTMKIAIDASQIIYGTGVSVYTKHLIRALLSIDKRNSYQVFGGALRRYFELKNVLSDITGDRENVSTTVFPLSPAISDLLFNRVGFPNIDTLLGMVDVYHSSDWTQPTSRAYKVTTIHDLAPILYPKLSHPRIVSVHKRRLERVKTIVDSIIVPSIATKSDLIRLGFEEKKIRVIYEAADPDLKRSKPDEISFVKRKYRIGDKYLLAVGTSKRKNTEGIIAAFEKIRADRDLKLVVIGRYEKVVSVRNVMFLGHTDDNDLNALYSGAETLVYPSLYEGFGIPILEGFSFATPVVTSNVGSMKEIAGDGAVLVDPNDIDSIKEGIEKVLENKSKYVQMGKERLKDFSWKNAAEGTLKVYNQALKK